MLLVPTRVQNSPIHGLGCFAQQGILKGQPVWVFHPGLDVEIPVPQIFAYPTLVQDFLKVYGYTQKSEAGKSMILCGDNCRYMNHSDDPNVVDAEDGSSVAARDIAAGEELTCDYFSFDLDSNRNFLSREVANR